MTKISVALLCYFVLYFGSVATSFSDKVALVTGAGSGIGEATALLLAASGAHVALVDINEARLCKVAEQCEAHGAKPLTIKANVSNDDEAKTIIQKTVDHFGQLDILVNSAGIVRFAPITDPNLMTTYDSIMNTNLRSIVLLTSLAAPHLAVTKGNIINVSSVESRNVLAYFSSYCVSKAGLDHFTRCAALELAAFGVRVNSVNPGPVRTNFLEGILTNDAEIDATWDRLKTMTALKHVSEKEEIADLIVFLASDKAKSITGSVYEIDNGVVLTRALVDQ